MIIRCANPGSGVRVLGAAPPRRTPKPELRQHGFTMLEMLVAVTATMIMVLFLNQIFTSMSGAVSAGKATSVIVENTRVIIPQLGKDAEQMLGPGENGVLVIINRLIPADQNNNGNPNNRDDLRLARDSANTIIAGLRADQVMWIRHTTDETPVAPSTVVGYDSNTKTPYARIWYGHALKTDEAGLSPLGSDLGDPGSPDQYASTWILGRQALFMFDGSPGASVMARGGWASAAVVGFGSTNNRSPYYGNGSYPAVPADPESHGGIYMGLTDRAYFGLVQTTSPHGAMIDNGSGAGNPAGAPARLAPAMTSAAYRDNIYGYSFAVERLRISPVPHYPSPVPVNDPYEAWQIAQMHSFLSERVVSFEVQFAGDYDNLDGIDVWDHDNNPVTAPLTLWYDAEIPTSPATITPNRHLAVDVPASTKCFVTAGAGGNQQPIYDGNPVPLHADATYVFRHSDPANNNWPYMLKFRYRLVDSQGRLVGSDGLPGKLFEQVVRVIRN